MVKKIGVFLAGMQPVHNAYLYMVNKALEESDKVLIVLGSENKVDMLRNPYDIKYIEKYCPTSVINRFDYLASYYKNVKENSKMDFSME